MLDYNFELKGVKYKIQSKAGKDIYSIIRVPEDDIDFSDEVTEKEKEDIKAYLLEIGKISNEATLDNGTYVD